MEKIGIQIVDLHTEEVIENFYAPSVPFEVGDTIHLEIKVQDSKFWKNIKPRSGYFRIVKIAKFLKMDYMRGIKQILPSTNDTLTIEMSVIEVN